MLDLFDLLTMLQLRKKKVKKNIKIWVVNAAPEPLSSPGYISLCWLQIIYIQFSLSPVSLSLTDRLTLSAEIIIDIYHKKSVKISNFCCLVMVKFDSSVTFLTNLRFLHFKHNSHIILYYSRACLKLGCNLKIVIVLNNIYSIKTLCHKR